MLKFSLIYKFLVMLALVGILSVVVTGVFYYNDKKKSIEKITQEKLQSVTEANKYFIETYFRERLNDAELLAHSENTYQLINELIQYKEQFNITDIDPFLTNVEEWKNIYNKYHKYFKTSQIIHSYHDILLVNKNGQVVFSCVEEKTLGEHLLTGRLKNSNLSSVWKKSKDSTTPIISDFETFVSSQNQMFAFVACPIYNEKDEYIASIILQLHVALLNEFIVKQFEKLPEFECLIVGSDYQVRLFHSQKIVEKYTLHENSNSYIDKALNSITGYTRYTDIDNIDYFACYTPLQIASMNWVLLIRVSTQIVMNPLKKIFFIVISLIFSILLSVIILYFPLNKLLIGNLKDIQHALNVLNIGEIPESIKHTNIDAEFSKISQEINTLSLGVNKLAKFANEIADNNLNTDFTPRSNADVLSKSLINIRKSLIDARQAELTRKEEDKIRNWANDGTNKLSDILQIRSESIIELTDKVVIFLVHYMNANQCGLFVYNEDDPTDECLELTSTYAYNRKKHMNKKVSVGESLIGMCALEKQTIYLDDIPENYIEVTSGLGDATPKYLLLVPLKHEENLMGIVEMASFNPFPQHEIEFLEKSGESIAASLANAKINQRTQKLLTDTKLQAEEMAAQEEEMRQNLEEMQATREEAARKERELGNIIHSIDHTLLRAEVDINGIILNTNDKFLSLLNYTWNEVDGAFLKAFLSKANDEKLFDTWKTLTEGESVEGIYSAKGKDGKQFWLIASFTPSFDEEEKIEKIIVLANDITEQKDSEQAIRKNSEQLKAQEAVLLKGLEQMKSIQAQLKEVENKHHILIQAIDNLTIRAEFSPELELISANHLFTSFFEFVTDKFTMFNIKTFISQNELEIFHHSWQNVCNGNIQKFAIGFHINQDLKKWLTISLVPVYVDKKVVKILFVAVDCTAEKVFENELTQSKGMILQNEKSLKYEIEKFEVKQNELLQIINSREEQLNQLKVEYQAEKQKFTKELDDKKANISELHENLNSLNQTLKEHEDASVNFVEISESGSETDNKINNWLNSFKK